MEAERLMKEEAQRADRLAEAAKDADAGLAQQLEAETARREEAEAALASLRAASPPPPPVPPQEPLRRARVVDAAHVTAQPGAAGRPGRRVPRGVARSGVAAVAWEDGASEPVQLELRAGAPSAPGAPFALAGAQLCFVVKSTSLFRRRKPPPPLSLAALYGARAGAGGEAALADRSIALAAEGDDRQQREVVLEFPTEGGAAEALAGFRHALDALQHHPHAPVAAAVAAAANFTAAAATKGGHRGRRRRAREAAPAGAREQPEDDAPDARDAERRQPRLGEDRGIKTGDGGPAVAAGKRATACTPTTRACASSWASGPAAGLRQRGAPADVRRPLERHAQKAPIVRVTFLFFTARFDTATKKIPAPSNSQQNDG